MEEHDGVAALAADPVTRPSSTSTSGSLPQLPGISSLASVDSAGESPQMREEREANFATATVPQQEPLQDQEQQQQHHQQQAPFEQPAQHQMQPDQQQLQQPEEQQHPQEHELEPPTARPEPQVIPQLSQPATAAPAPTPAISTGGQAQTTPTCQNCQTGTTPLWRRDEFGAVLCNACGLFLKLHGRPRPISLKTDVIKSRNRVKTMRPDLATKKKQQQQAQQAQQQHQQAQAAASNFPGADPNGFDLNATPTGQRLHGQKSVNGHGDGTNSPGSRGDTPLYNPAMPVFHGADDPNFQSSALSGFLSGASPNRPGSPLNGERKPDAPQTHEQLIAANSALKTRVSELEVIIELFRGRLGQLEGDEANARRAQEISSQAEREMRAQLEDSHRRENNLKRRLDEMEVEMMAAKEVAGGVDSERAAKRPRLSEPVEDAPAPPGPQEAAPVEDAPSAEELPEQPVEAAPAEQPAAA